MLNQLIRFSLSHRALVLAAALLVSLYGVITLQGLAVDVFPDLNRPTVNIMTEAPGMAPEEVETLVSIPLETALNGLPGVERVRSVSGIGLSAIYVEFGWGTEIYRNRQLVAEKLQLVQERLPRGVRPVMGPVSSIMGEIQLIGLASPDGKLSPIELRTLADWNIRPRLLAIPGIAQVISIGGGVKQFQILLSAEKIQRFRLSLEEIEKALAKIGLNSTGGFIDLRGRELLIRNIGTVKTEGDILGTVVGSHLGRPVLVKDVAEVRIGAQVKRGDASVNGNPAVILSVQKQPGADTILLTREIDRALAELRSSFPAGVELHPELFRQAQFIDAAIGNVREALRDGSFLVLVVLFLFLLSFRTTLITLSAIPLSFLVTVIVFRAAGLSVNTMTLGGLAIAIGELVDDAIVDVENVFRRLRENARLERPRNALRVVFEASSEVRNSIVFATIIVVLVFVPLFFLGGIEGRLFIPLGVAYIVALLASLLVSLTVTPVLCSYLLGSLPRERGDGALVRWLKRMDERLLRWALAHPRPVISVCLALFLGALAMIPFFGRDFLPKFNEGTATVNVIAQPGISLEESGRIGAAAERLLLQVPELRSVARRTGRAELDEHAEGVHYSEIDVDFKDGGRPRPQVLEEMRTRLAELPGVFTSIGQPISHRLDHLLSGVRAQIAIKIFGPDLAVLRQKAAEIHSALASTPGLVDLQVEPQVLVPQLKIQLMREELARFGLVSGEVVESLEKALNGEEVAWILDQQRSFAAFLRLDDHSRSSPELIEGTTLRFLPDGRKVRLGDVADVYEAEGPNQIGRENSQRRIIVSANVSGRDLETVIGEIQKRIAEKISLPSGTFLRYGGQFESQRAASRLIALLGLLSLLGVFAVLYAHFRSGLLALQVMLNIPLALIGSVFAVFFSGLSFSVATQVAFITLCGIASRNGIMMISHYLHLIREEGESFTKEMVIRGSLERLVPVLMTALTAILGLLPLALSAGAPGKEILHPVAIVIIGGLLSSTLLDMLLTPVVFFHFGRKAVDAALRTGDDPLMNSKGNA